VSRALPVFTRLARMALSHVSQVTVQFGHLTADKYCGVGQNWRGLNGLKK